VLEKVPLLVLSVAVCVVTVLSQSGQAVVSLERLPFEARVANALLAYALYLRKTLFPFDLAIFYPHPGTHISWPALGGAILVLGTLTALAVILRRRCPALLVGWLWFLGTLVPVIGLVQVGQQSMADRYTYFPLIGLFLALAWLLPSPAPGRPWVRALVPTGVVLVLSGCCLLTWFQLATWQDEGTVWQQALRVTENNATARASWGTLLFKRGRMAEGVAQLEQAVELNPRHALALHNLGLARRLEGDTDRALDLLTQAVANAPWVGVYHNSLGLALLRKGRRAQARDQFEEAIRLEPNQAEYHFNRAVTLTDPHDAETANQAGLRLNPSWPQWAVFLTRLLLQPADRRFRCPEEALLRATQANALTGGSSPEVLATLGIACAESGRMKRATATVRKALERAHEEGKADLVQQLRVLLRNYESAPPGPADADDS
jgi:tetratricopeptide (TPR) repeat protein